MLLVSGAGPDPSDGPGDNRFSAAWDALRKLNADLVDEHFYRPPDWFYSQVHRYDNYDRKGPKVFAGEFAAHVRNKRPAHGANTWEAALAEAALMTGLERNGDVVRLASYAPLFAHVEAWQWSPNLIWFDNLRSLGTPSYYVQKLFSTNRGTTILPVALGADDAAEKLYACASADARTGQIVLKIVNARPTDRDVRIRLEGVASVQPTGELQVLAASDPNAVNTLDDPRHVSPVVTAVSGLAPDFHRQVPGYSLVVLRIGTVKDPEEGKRP
jgi:alpha-L-arabinofuranosidase